MTLCDGELMARDFKVCPARRGNGPGVGRGEGGDREVRCFSISGRRFATGAVASTLL